LSSHRLTSSELILNLISKNTRIINIGLRNMNLQPEDIRAIIDSILAKQQIIALDISNKGSDWLNRLSETTILL
jgi:hypothetical protein